MDRAQSYYHKVCGQLNIVPITYFTRHIHDPNLTMRFHGLSADETMAIALALRVSPMWLSVLNVILPHRSSKICG